MSFAGSFFPDAEEVLKSHLSRNDLSQNDLFSLTQN